MSKGFVQLLESVQDQTLDVPETPEILTLFLVRASVDDILPHAFLKVRGGPRTRSALEHPRARVFAVSFVVPAFPAYAATGSNTGPRFSFSKDMSFPDQAALLRRGRSERGP